MRSKIYYAVNEPERGFFKREKKMFNKLANYIKETKIEMKGVKWPTKKQAVNYTLLVIVASIGVAIFLGAFDMLFAYLLGKFVL